MSSDTTSTTATVAVTPAGAPDGYAAVPLWLCVREDITQGAKLAYGRLAYYAWNNGTAYPSLPKLGTELGVSARQAWDYLQELKSARLIKATARPGRTTIVSLIEPMNSSSRVDPGTPVRAPLNSSSRDPGTPVHTNKGSRKETQEAPSADGDQFRLSSEPLTKTKTRPTHRKGARVDANTPAMDQIGAWFGRRTTTRWSREEAAALEALGQVDAEELDLLHSFYTAEHPAERDPRRRHVDTLINNWNGEVDKARRWAAQQAQPEGNIV